MRHKVRALCVCLVRAYLQTAAEFVYATVQIQYSLTARQLEMQVHDGAAVQVQHSLIATQLDCNTA